MRSIAQQLFEIPPAWHDRVLYSTATGRLTYAEVRARMLAVAAWLGQSQAVAPGRRVALCLPKNLEAACLLYGALAAGATVSSLQLNGPPERLLAQLASFQPHLLVTTGRMKQKLGTQALKAPLPRIASVEATADGRGLDGLVRGVATLPQPVAVDPDALAAVYFTSGSTGEPKGIMLSFGGMAGSVAVLASAGATADDRMINVAPFQYAASLQIFCPLISGCSMRLMTEEEAMFPDRIAAVLRQERISVWEGTATVLRLVVEEEAAKGAPLDGIRRVKFFGERLPVPILRKAMALMPNAAFENAYGASEAFRILVYRIPRPLPEDLETLPLGQPTEAYGMTLRDAQGLPVPEGEVGEICVVGDTVMKGYWRRSAMTEASRIPGLPRSYRTGDLARLGKDGNYHLVGRADHRVKLRGHRFDLGEVEAALKSHPAVREAVAVVLEAGPLKERILGVVAGAPGDGLVDALKSLCAKRLPVFARPASIVLVDRLPQLPSGKIDRKALQALGGAGQFPA